MYSVFTFDIEYWVSHFKATISEHEAQAPLFTKIILRDMGRITSQFKISVLDLLDISES